MTTIEVVNVTHVEFEMLTDVIGGKKIVISTWFMNLKAEKVWAGHLNEFIYS